MVGDRLVETGRRVGEQRRVYHGFEQNLLPDFSWQPQRRTRVHLHGNQSRRARSISMSEVRGND